VLFIPLYEFWYDFVSFCNISLCTDVRSMSLGHISRQMLEDAMSRFHGEILQTPPLYSALKLHGHRVADLTRYNYLNA